MQFFAGGLGVHARWKIMLRKWIWGKLRAGKRLNLPQRALRKAKAKDLAQSAQRKAEGTESDGRGGFCGVDWAHR